MQEKIQIEKVIEELERYFSKEDLVGAGIHLEESLKIAEEQNDWQCKLSILNEQIGYYRRAGKKRFGFRSCRQKFLK